MLGDSKRCNACQANYSVGAIRSTSVKPKFLDSESAQRPMCKQPGDAKHILYECPATRSIRDEIDIRGLDSLPNAV